MLNNGDMVMIERRQSDGSWKPHKPYKVLGFNHLYIFTESDYSNEMVINRNNGVVTASPDHRIALDDLAKVEGA